jgi:glycosyltransferase involved in cell wall biosynthesis
MPLTAAVVVPTYRRREQLPRLLEPLFADPGASEIIVVVDGCDDGSYELLEELATREPRLKPIWQDNAGEAAARHRGISAASADVVVILDDDVIPSPGLVSGHLRHHERSPNLVVVGYMPTTIPDTFRPGQATTVLYQRDYEKVCRLYEADPRNVLNFLWAGNLSMRRADALRVNFAAQARLRYHADQLFGLRCADAGLQGVFDRGLAAEHQHARDFAAFAEECYYQGEAAVELERRYPHLAQLEQQSLVERVLGVLGRAGRASKLLLDGLVRLAGLAGRRGWPSAELLSARILRQVAISVGKRDRLAEVSSGRGLPTDLATT